MLTWILVPFLILSHGTEDNMRFTKWEDLLSPTPQQTAFKNAVKFIKTDNGTCTATVISDSGHYLSARHCLTKCMIRNKILEEKHLEDGAITYFEFSKKNALSAECQIQVEKQDVTIQIEASSPGFILNMHEATFKTLQKKIYDGFVKEGYTGEGDFVIFKIKNAPLSPTHCLPLSQKPVVAGDRQETIGYPGETFRPDGFNSDGTSLYYSRGAALPSISENSCVKAMNFKNNEYSELLKEFDNPTGFVSTVDAIYGSSGSAVMGPDGQISGILTNTFRLAQYTKLESDEPDNLFCKGSARALSTLTILRSLEKQGYDTNALKCSLSVM